MSEAETSYLTCEYFYSVNSRTLRFQQLLRKTLINILQLRIEKQTYNFIIIGVQRPLGSSAGINKWPVANFRII